MNPITPNSNSNHNSGRHFGNWITDYTKVVYQMSESPDQFNMWSAISAVSAVLKNNVYFDRGNVIVYPNQYIVLVGPPGVGKGTAIHPAHNIVKNPPSKVSLANYIMDRVTAAKCCELLSDGWTKTHFSNGNMLNTKEATCVFQSTELRTLLNNGEWMTDLLCEAWDRNEYTYLTKNKGNAIIKDMCVSLIGSCTPTFVRDINKQKSTVVNGGFTARTIFVFGKEKSKYIVWPQGFKSSQNLITIEKNLGDDLQRISQLHGEMRFNTGARTIFENLYPTLTPNEHDSEIVANFKSRQWGHILKVAMAFSAAQSDTLIINEFCINAAISLVEGVLNSLDECFRGVGESPLAEPMSKIEHFLEEKGSANYVELIQQFRKDITLMELESILGMLCAGNIIKEYSSGGYKCYQFVAARNTSKATPATP